ncbi:hypothetical protein HK405_001814, partial [Cladochytrium tenue]
MGPDIGADFGYAVGNSAGQALTAYTGLHGTPGGHVIEACTAAMGCAAGHYLGSKLAGTPDRSVAKSGAAGLKAFGGALVAKS